MSAKLSFSHDSYRTASRRRFTRAFKRELVQKLLSSPESMSRVAREHDLNQNQLAKWRREYQQGLFDDMGVVRLVPVAVDVEASPCEPVIDVQSRSDMASSGLEVVLPKGRLLIHARPDTDLLRSVIEAMQ